MSNIGSYYENKYGEDYVWEHEGLSDEDIIDCLHWYFKCCDNNIDYIDEIEVFGSLYDKVGDSVFGYEMYAGKHPHLMKDALFMLRVAEEFAEDEMYCLLAEDSDPRDNYTEDVDDLNAVGGDEEALCNIDW